MKSQLLVIAALIAAMSARSQQTLFEEDWDGAGPGIESWTLHDIDGLAPWTDGDPLPGLVTQAWNVISLEAIQTALDDATFQYPPGATGMQGNVAASTSWYDPAGTANDWLVSPPITIPAGATGVNLTWAATSMGDTQWLEDYEILISTSENIDTFTLLLDVPNELNSGSYRNVPLDDFAGQTIYIAFRNKSNDQYVMLLDNIMVTAENVAGVQDHLISGLLVYPNPASGIINVACPDNTRIGDIKITDINGRIVKSLQYKGVANAQVDISCFAPGEYIMVVSSDKTRMIKKIVKTN